MAESRGQVKRVQLLPVDRIIPSSKIVRQRKWGASLYWGHGFLTASNEELHVKLKCGRRGDSWNH